MALEEVTWMANEGALVMEDMENFDIIYRTYPRDDLLQMINDAVVEVRRNLQPSCDKDQQSTEKYFEVILDDAWFERLAQDGDLAHTDDIGQTALHLAVIWCEAWVVQRLLQLGARPDTPDNSGMTPVHCCALRGTPAKFALIPNNIWELREENGGKYPLHFAGMSGNMEIVELIVQSGADIDIQDYSGHTPLIIAALYSQPDCVKLFIDRGSKSGVTDINGIPALVVVYVKYPSLGHLMLDRGLKLDEYKGKLNVDLGFLLAKPKKEEDKGPRSMEKCTSFQSLVALSAEATSHTAVKVLTDIKWESYAKKIFYTEFFCYLAFNCFWTLRYIVFLETKTFKGDTAVICILTVISVAMLMTSGVWSVYVSRKERKWSQKLIKMMINRKLFEKTHKNHFTEPYFETMEKMYKMTSGAVTKEGRQDMMEHFMILFIHVTLLINSLEKIRYFPNGEEIDTDAVSTKMLEVVMSVVLMTMWMRLFWYCSVHAAIGKFVIFTKEVLKDAGLIGAVFVFLYIPYVAIMYHSFHRYETGSTSSWYEIPFLVLRMVFVDYDYESGKTIASDRGMGFWWAITVVGWLFASSLIVLNLFIALMSDRYSMLGDRARVILALKRAKYVARCEMVMGSERVERLNAIISKENKFLALQCTAEILDAQKSTEKDIEQLKDKVDQILTLLQDRQEASMVVL